MFEWSAYRDPIIGGSHSGGSSDCRDVNHNVIDSHKLKPGNYKHICPNCGYTITFSHGKFPGVYSKLILI